MKVCPYCGSNWPENQLRCWDGANGCGGSLGEGIAYPSIHQYAEYEEFSNSSRFETCCTPMFSYVACGNSPHLPPMPKGRGSW